jgi:hypothetical protein
VALSQQTLRRRRVLLAAMLAQLTAAPCALAAGSTATGLATATVIRPLRVIATADMNFGTITHLPGTSGTVTVSPGAAGATFSGGAGAGCAGSDCTTAHAARFAVSGEPQRDYTVQLPASVIATGSTGNPGAVLAPLTVGNLTLRTASGGAAPRLDAAGTDHFEVGGTITLPADLPPAHYRASFAVMVTYI